MILLRHGTCRALYMISLLMLLMKANESKLTAGSTHPHAAARPYF